MADVGQRGQLILVTGLLIAVILIGLALVVNGAIYTENLSTRESSNEPREALEQRHVTEGDVQSLIDTANRNATTDDYGVVRDAFVDGLTLWADSQRAEKLRTGRLVSTELNSTTEGTQIRQTNASRNLTAGGSLAGDANWTLVEDTTEAGPFVLDIDRASLLNITDFDTLSDPLAAVSDNAFHVSVETTSGTWKVYLFRDGTAGEVYLYVVDPGEDIGALSDLSALVSNSCVAGATGSSATVDFREPRFGTDATDCPELDFYNTSVVGTDHHIHYRNARTSAIGLLGETDRARGTYELVVDTRADRTPYYGPGTAVNPRARSIIHAVTVDAEFRSDGVVHGSDEIEAEWSVVK
ncbi:hypothetical protein GJ631_11755 [Natronomonas sp. CBA1123]|uniref:DUF7261 family protein n=1 Tax=Natronomonas sp. CBA1123 TaxID=2668070 RepID=UPI0012EAD32D|nr:hypothetical protein [Natronomonas sp. CBA1123]MUV87220.1 hypothetical protein [Natronomonas sp. CBA1123]